MKATPSLLHNLEDIDERMKFVELLQATVRLRLNKKKRIENFIKSFKNLGLFTETIKHENERPF